MSDAWARVRVRVRAGIRIQFLNRREVIEMNYAQHTPATFKQAAMQQISNIFRTYAACPSQIADKRSPRLRWELTASAPAPARAGTGLVGCPQPADRMTPWPSGSRPKWERTCLVGTGLSGKGA